MTRLFSAYLAVNRRLVLRGPAAPGAYANRVESAAHAAPEDMRSLDHAGQERVDDHIARAPSIVSLALRSLALRRRGPEIDLGLDGEFVDIGQFLVAEVQVLQGAGAVLKLCGAACADER